MMAMLNIYMYIFLQGVYCTYKSTVYYRLQHPIFSHLWYCTLPETLHSSLPSVFILLPLWLMGVKHLEQEVIVIHIYVFNLVYGFEVYWSFYLLNFLCLCQC